MAGLWGRVFGAAEPPAGSVDDAFRLLQTGRIADGRTLLRAICHHDGSNLLAHVLAASEFRREPKEPGELPKLLARVQALDPDRTLPEVQTLFAFLDVLEFDGDGYVRAYEGIPGEVPADPHAAALHLLTRVLLSDCTAQTKILAPGEFIRAAIVQPATQGGALLVLRDERASATFQRGLDNPDATLQAYEEYVERALAPGMKADLIASLKMECVIGQGLVLRDKGRAPDARELFRMAARELKSGATLDALNTLIAEAG